MSLVQQYGGNRFRFFGAFTSFTNEGLAPAKTVAARPQIDACNVQRPLGTWVKALQLCLGFSSCWEALKWFFSVGFPFTNQRAFPKKDTHLVSKQAYLPRGTWLIFEMQLQASTL